MMALARADVRRFRAVARRAQRPGQPRGPAPPIRIIAESGTLTLTAHLGEVVVALRTPADRPDDGSVTVPMDALAACEGRTGEATLQSGRNGAVTVRWTDGSDQQKATFDPPEVNLAWPAEPEHLVAMPPHLPLALHEAGRSAARDPGKYAVTRVQVRGKAGEVIGTDGKQALVWGGFHFPFPEDLLVPAVPVFGSKPLAAEAAVSLGRVDGWLYLVIGPWRVWLLIDAEGRFPDVRGAVPRATGTRLDVSDPDSHALLAALSHLPGDDTNRPVTLDLGPHPAIRAQPDGSGRMAELVLSGSQVTGPPVRVVLCREHLGRALALGFREFRIASSERPVVARGDSRLYLVAALDPSTAVGAEPPTETAIQTRRIPVPSRDTPPVDRNGHSDPPPTGEPIDPLAEAEALRAVLTEAASRAARLVGALRQFRKEKRVLANAFSSLRQLNLGP